MIITLWSSLLYVFFYSLDSGPDRTCTANPFLLCPAFLSCRKVISSGTFFLHLMIFTPYILAYHRFITIIFADIMPWWIFRNIQLPVGIYCLLSTYSNLPTELCFLIIHDGCVVLLLICLTWVMLHAKLLIGACYSRVQSWESPQWGFFMLFLCHCSTNIHLTRGTIECFLHSQCITGFTEYDFYHSRPSSPTLYCLLSIINTSFLSNIDT